MARFRLAGLVVAGSVGALLVWFGVRHLMRRRLPGTVIVSPRRSTVIAADGAVRSTQAARLTLPRRDLERLWTPANLEDFGRTYWRFLSRATLGLIRVVYAHNERSVVLIAKPLTLLRFEAPDYLLEPRHGRISWRIRDGLLVARSGHGSGWLSFDVTCEDAGGERADATADRDRQQKNTPEKGGLGEDGPGKDGLGKDGPGKDGLDQASIEIEAEVANFYPAIAAGVSTAVYEATQAFVHVLVTHAFLRSLAKLELAESKIRRFTHAPPRDPSGETPTRTSGKARVYP